MNKTTYILFLIFSLVFQQEVLSQNRHIRAGDEAFEEQLYKEAAEKYKKGYKKLKNKDDKKVVAFKLAEAYRLTNELRRAKAQYKRLFRYEAQLENPEIVLRYGQILLMLEEFKEADIQFQIYDSLVGDDPQAKIAIESIKFARRTLENPKNYSLENIKKINSKFDDFSPSYQDNNYQSLYFTSTREEAFGKDLDGWTGEDFSSIFYAKLDRKGEWSKPELIDEEEVINTKGNEGQSTFNSRFNRMYFTRCFTSPDRPCGCLIMQSKRSGRSWEDPEVIELGSDSSHVVGHPAISEDERIIIFAADFERGYGGKDLYIATRESKLEEFGRPRNLGPIINTKADEMYPFLRNDTTLYFSSNGHIRLGGLDIYQIFIKGDTVFNQAENMGYPINTPSDDFGIIFDPNQQEAGYLSSSRPGGRGSADIYSFVLPPLEYSISGVITDDYTYQVIEGMDVLLLGSDGSEKKTKTIQDGSFTFNKQQVFPDTEYEIVFERERYFRLVLKETTVGLNHSKDIQIEVELQRIPETPILLPEILFDLAKWDLKPQFEDSLQGLIETMDANPHIIVELGAHTDARGNDEQNDILSQKRAESVVNYLILRGIDPGRLFAKGYGEQTPRTLDKHVKKEGVTFPANIQLTETYIDSLPSNQKEIAHSMNRRIEFRIVGKDYQERSLAEQGDTSDIRIQMGDKKNRIFFKMPANKMYETDCSLNGYNNKVIYTPLTNLVTCSVEFALELLQQGVIKKEDFKGNPEDIISTGNIIHKSVFTLKDFRLGNKTIRNLDVYVWHGSMYPFLINKVTLEKFGKPVIEEERFIITFD
ncbi:MAG: OmpA family protein [Bacteroidales bacterium]|nr:OmpA family protein [Bacteroidales bacterium]